MANRKIFNFLEEGLEKVLKAQHSFRNSGKRTVTFRPFFASLAAREIESYSLWIENGGLVTRDYDPRHVCPGRVEVRMGGYDSGGMGSWPFELPCDLDIKSSMHEIWLASNSAFWDCVQDQSTRDLMAVGSKNQREKYRIFTKEVGDKYSGPEKRISVDLAEVEKMLKAASAEIWQEGKNLVDADITMRVRREGRHIVNSEGARIYYDSLRSMVGVSVEAIDAHGWVIQHGRNFFPDGMVRPEHYRAIVNLGEELREELAEIIASPLQKNGSYPAILDPENHGVLWHEMIGHALEGTSMKTETGQNGQKEDKVSLFLGKLGRKVAPEFISVDDDPTIKRLDGYYPYDDEGARAQRVRLIERGVLRDYLHSRESAGFFRTNSNGHARSEQSKDPVARMSNLIVRSSNEVPLDQLKENLLRICAEQNEPYGLIFEGSAGGLTIPERSHFETYPSKIFRLYRNGKVEQVRGAYIVGTPYQIIRNIVQTSNQYGVFRGECGAQSGWVPSTQEAPHALVNSLEINQFPETKYQQFRKLVVKK
ncbi:Zinc metalloprotease TldD [uncultured archaeon]|nr:Zinc metalloprotease TldD [uncultured archaeon]